MKILDVLLNLAVLVAFVLPWGLLVLALGARLAAKFRRKKPRYPQDRADDIW